MSNHWPALSKDLPHERHPCICQACGGVLGEGRCNNLRKWIECDGKDQPTDTLVILCDPCGKKLIDPHPRLYHAVYGDKPIPGAIHNLCASCGFRRGLTCTHKDLTVNGGAGLNIKTKKLGTAHLYFGGGKGAWIEQWAPAAGCAGHTTEDLR